MFGGFATAGGREKMMLKFVERVGDALLRVVLPVRTASANETFTQYCYCMFEYQWYRKCYWLGQAGGDFVCAACYRGTPRC